MKKLFSILAIAFSVSCLSQVKTDSSYHIVKLLDDMTDKVYYMPSSNFVLANEKKTQGFKLDFFIKGNSDDEIEATGLSIIMVDIGSCCENNVIIILLEGGEKISLKSWNKFNCEGKAYFKIGKDEVESLSKNKAIKIRVENGRTHDSFTKEVPEKNQDYFIQVIRAIKEKRIKTEK